MANPPTVIDDGTGPASAQDIAAVDAANGATGPRVTTPPASASIDVVAVYKMSDPSAQVFVAARPMTGSVRERGQLMRHPLEDGSKITDHIVFDPIEITLPVIIRGDFKPVLDEIRALYRAATRLTVQTRAGSYSNMVLSELPHEETPDMFDAIMVTLQFGEAVFIKPKTGGIVPRHKKQASTAKRGQVQASAAAAPPRGSFLYRHVKVGP